VIRRYIFTTTLALACSGMIAAAQQPAPGSAAPSPDQQGQRPATPTTQSPTTPSTAGAANRQASSTFVGCLYAEAQIPGRTPNPAERAGVREDYIIANAMMGAAGAATPGATPGAAGTSGTAARAGGMYKIENIPGDRLKALVGKRVEVTGRVDPEGSTPAGAASPDRNVGPDAVSLAEIEADNIREVPGTCPASPAASPTPGAGATTPGAGATTPGGNTTPGGSTPR
jgi:hypothetical protein